MLESWLRSKTIPQARDAGASGAAHGSRQFAPDDRLAAGADRAHGVSVAARDQQKGWTASRAAATADGRAISPSQGGDLCDPC